MLCGAKRIIIAAVAVVSLPLAAHAGIADSPLPAGFTVHVYSVPGIQNTGAIGTYYSCTNVDTGPVTIGVEEFGQGGGAPINNAGLTAVSVAPGASIVFGSRTSNSIHTDVDISAISPATIPAGSARIVATSKKIVCTAMLADPTSNPPISMTYLTIVAKTKQKAAN